MVMAISAMLNVQKRSAPTPISMKSTTPREERRRSQALPKAPAMTRAKAALRRASLEPDLRYHSPRIPATKRLKTPRISLPCSPAGSPIAAESLKVRLKRTVSPTTSCGSPGKRDSTAALLVVQSARKTVIRRGQKIRVFFSNLSHLLRGQEALAPSLLKGPGPLDGRVSSYTG
jgi:hypothetical protein